FTSRDKLPAMMRPSGPLAEAYRMLRLNIEFAIADRNVRVLMVTSAMEGEGKTTTAANLAVALARAGPNVILVDADFRRPAPAMLFSAPSSPGLVEVATHEAPLTRALTSIRMLDPVPEEPGQRQVGSPLTLMSPVERRRIASERITGQTEQKGSLRLL